MAFGAFDRLSKLNALEIGAQRSEYDAVPWLRLDPAAHSDFLTWRSDLERRLRSSEMSPALEGHLAKFRTLVPAIALINHLADGGTGDVGQMPMLRSLALATYLESHARRIYGSGSEGETAAAKAILKHIKVGDLKDGFTARDVHQAGWAHLTERDHVGLGLGLLVDRDYLAASAIGVGPQGGRPKATYQINPRLKP